MLNTNFSSPRSLHFRTIEDLLVEMDRLVFAHKDGTLKQLGNWSLGKAFGHLAAWINYGWEGYPMRVPWYLRPLTRLAKGRYLRGFKAGIRLPGAKGGTYGVQEMSVEDGHYKLSQSLQRLKKGEPIRFQSPAFGPLTHEERMQINLRHAELHLGNYVPMVAVTV